MDGWIDGWVDRWMGGSEEEVYDRVTPEEQ